MTSFDRTSPFLMSSFDRTLLKTGLHVLLTKICLAELNAQVAE